MKNNKLIALTAIYKARAYQYAVYKEQNKILAQNKMLWAKRKQTISDQELIKTVKRTIENDLALIASIDQLIVDHKEGLHIGIQTNKMQEVLSGTHDLFHNEANILSIANGLLPNGYNNDMGTDLPIVGGQGYYGTSSSTFVSCAIWYLYFALNQVSVNEVDIFNAPTVHVIPLPSDFRMLPNYSWHYTKGGVNGFGFVHSGYSFGGSRFEEALYPNNKIFAPQDCSSFVDLVSAVREPLTTQGQLCIYRSYMGGFIPKSWKDSKQTSLVSLYQPVQAADVQVGDIYAWRLFDSAHTPETSVGIEGHTTIVIDKTDKEVIAVGDDRDMPTMEGIGIQTFAFSSEPNKQVFFLRLRDDYIDALPDPGNFKSFNYNSIQDLVGFIKYVDQLIDNQQ